MTWRVDSLSESGTGIAFGQDYLAQQIRNYLAGESRNQAVWAFVFCEPVAVARDPCSNGS